MDARRFSPAQDVLSKNQLRHHEPSALCAEGATPGVCFLLVTFLCTSKEK